MEVRGNQWEVELVSDAGRLCQMRVRSKEASDTIKCLAAQWEWGVVSDVSDQKLTLPWMPASRHGRCVDFSNSQWG